MDESSKRYQIGFELRQKPGFMAIYRLLDSKKSLSQFWEEYIEIVRIEANEGQLPTNNAVLNNTVVVLVVKQDEMSRLLSPKGIFSLEKYPPCYSLEIVISKEMNRTIDASLTGDDITFKYNTIFFDKTPKKPEPKIDTYNIYNSISKGLLKGTGYDFSKKELSNKVILPDTIDLRGDRDDLLILSKLKQGEIKSPRAQELYLNSKYVQPNDYVQGEFTTKYEFRILIVSDGRIKQRDCKKAGNRPCRSLRNQESNIMVKMVDNLKYSLSTYRKNNSKLNFMFHDTSLASGFLVDIYNIFTTNVQENKLTETAAEEPSETAAISPVEPVEAVEPAETVAEAPTLGGRKKSKTKSNRSKRNTRKRRKTKRKSKRKTKR